MEGLKDKFLQDLVQDRSKTSIDPDKKNHRGRYLKQDPINVSNIVFLSLLLASEARPSSIDDRPVDEYGVSNPVFLRPPPIKKGRSTEMPWSFPVLILQP